MNSPIEMKKQAANRSRKARVPRASRSDIPSSIGQADRVDRDAAVGQEPVALRRAVDEERGEAAADDREERRAR